MNAWDLGDHSRLACMVEVRNSIAGGRDLTDIRHVSV